MAKVKAAKRRSYEYDHEYGLSLQGKASKTSGTAARPVAMKRKKAAKKSR